MPNGHGLPADGGVLLSVKSSQRVEIPALPAERRLFGKVILWQAEGGLLGMLRKISFVEFIHIFSSFAVTTELTQEMQREKWDPATPFHESARKLKIFCFPGY